MKIFRLENILNVIVYAFLTFIIVIIVNQLDMGKTNNRYFNGFYSADSRKILINSKGTDFRIDTEALGTDFVLYDTVYDTEANSSTVTERVIYGKGEYPKPNMLEGHFFTDEEILSKEKTCVVGSKILEGIINSNGERYYEYYGERYKIIGVMGLDTACDLDLVIILNWGGYYDSDRTINTKYMIDSDTYGHSDEIFDKIWSQLEEYQKEHTEIVFENIYYENNIKGFDFYTRHLYFWAAVLVFINLFIVSARYSSKNIRVVAVKRLVGTPTAGIITSIAGKYSLTALGGVLLSFLFIKFLNVNSAFAKSDLAYFSALSGNTVHTVIICTVIISIICGLIPTIHIISKQDISSEIK